MCDCPYPAFFLQVIRTARKEHDCCECDIRIEKGDRYEYSSGMWDGEIDSFKTCESCAAIRKELEAKIAKTGSYCCVAFGNLDEELAEFEDMHRPLIKR